MAGPVQNLHESPPLIKPVPTIVMKVPPVVGPAEGVGRWRSSGGGQSWWWWCEIATPPSKLSSPCQSAAQCGVTKNHSLFQAGHYASESRSSPGRILLTGHADAAWCGSRHRCILTHHKSLDTGNGSLKSFECRSSPHSDNTVSITAIISAD